MRSYLFALCAKIFLIKFYARKGIEETPNY